MLTVKLGEVELRALKKHSLWWAKNFAGELARDFGGETEENLRRDLLAAMYVYGECERYEGHFVPCKGIREVGEEFVEVSFSEEAVAYLAERRAELKRELEARRGGVEMTGSGPKDVFVLFVLDGVIERGSRV